MTTETKSLKTSKIACWLALACLVVPMFGSYFFDDMFSTVSQIFKNPEMLKLTGTPSNSASMPAVIRSSAYGAA